MRGMGGMGYSVGFLRGILALAIAASALALAVGAINELFGLGWFEDGYPAIVGGRIGDAGRIGFGSFAVRLAAVIVVAALLNLLLDRFEPRRPPRS